MGLFRRRPPPGAPPPEPPREPPGASEARNRETDRMLAYHERTKHSYASVMRSGWTLDWDNQPNPFRRYAGAPRLSLPPAHGLPQELLPLRATGDVLRALAGPPEGSEGWRAGLPLLSSLLWHSLAVSAWKQVPGTDVRYSLRVNPSSGNLHPTEAHLLAAGVPGVPDGALHYDARRHALELRRTGAALPALLDACGLPPGDGVVVVLSSIFWREAWKYRDRAYRYCLHDAGHAAGCVAAAARALQLPAAVHGWFPDVAVRGLLGLADGDEQPLVLVDLRQAASARASAGHTDALSAPAGTPNVLSAEEQPWPLIDGMHASTLVESAHCPLVAPAGDPLADTPRGSRPADGARRLLPLPDSPPAPEPFARAARRRRSALDYDPDARLALPDFAGLLLEATRLPRADATASLDGGEPRRLIELYAWVHRVDDLAPGCWRYLPERHALLEVQLGDVRGVAAGLSLGQELAGRAVAAFSMIADLARAGAAFGCRGYRLAHVEAGLIGQGLYLAATARGWESTGIGAFFDDDVHRWLGLQGHARQVIYHHSVGRAVPDPRLVDSDEAVDMRDPT